MVAARDAWEEMTVLKRPVAAIAGSGQAHARLQHKLGRSVDLTQKYKTPVQVTQGSPDKYF